MKDRNNPYTILGVSKTATEEEIKQAYLNLVKIYNPEQYPDKFIVIRKAYEILTSIPEKAALDVYTYNLIKGSFVFSEATRKDLSIEELNQKITTLRENLTENNREELVNLFLQKAYNAVKKKLWQEAANAWEEALKIDPANQEAKNNLFYVYSILGYSYATHDLEEDAIELWSKAFNINPDSTELVHNLALAYENAGKIDKAKKYWRELTKRWRKELDKDPSNEYVKEMLIEIHRHFGGQLEKESKEEALEEYKEILKINPKDPLTRKKLLNSLVKEKKWDEAKKELEELLKDNPNDIELLVKKGWILLNSGNLAGAFNYWKKLLKKFPNTDTIKNSIIKAHLQLAERYREKKQLNSALVQLKSALRYKPDDADIYYQLGILYELQGKINSAITYYKKALEIDPKHQEARRKMIKAQMKR